MKTIIHSYCPQAKEAARIATERLRPLTGENDSPETLQLDFIRESRDGFRLDVGAENVRIGAAGTRDFIAGVGLLLTIIRASSDTGQWPAGQYTKTPRFPHRIHYMPGHFGNPFEVAWPGEMQHYLDDLALWGASGYADWFDPNDMPDPFSPHVYCSTSMTLWQRKKEFLRQANRLGLDTSLCVAHNVGFVDQMRPEWMGVRSLKHRVQGQVLCPSIPEARAVCLRNHENLFADLAESGIELNTVFYNPYDDGGCACDKCQPYFPTFLKMLPEIHAVAQRYFPNIKADLCGWWMEDDEIRQIAEFVKGPAKDWFRTFQVSVAYEAFGGSKAESVLKGFPQSIFFHIGYSHDKRDVYLTSGIHSAPLRIQKVIGGLEEQGSCGFITYNESFGDHYNQFLCTRLACEPEADPRELTCDYCRQMYGLSGKNLDTLAGILQEMEYLEPKKAEGWANELARLRPLITVPEQQPWAFEHLALKADLMALDHRIGSGKNWQSRTDIDPVLPLIEKRLALSERLWRVVYGLGILRHIFIPTFMMPEWYQPYAKQFLPSENRLKPDFVRVSQNA